MIALIFSGNYTVNILSLIGCSDKGISIGEKSKAAFNSVNVQKAHLAFVSKDSSELAVNNANVNDIEFCAAAYRKKQEFAGAKLVLPASICQQESIYIQKNSQISFK